ncbi:MAG TPA: hypothetical protein VH186_06615 [Chloroflexia bacterium]|nr:hypothetical protein [Chloroflexia bacterium]
MIYLGKHVVDKSLLDKDGYNAGKADDILLELPDSPGEDISECPVVKAIISGPLSLANLWPSPLRWLAKTFYHLTGIKDPQPVEIPWEEIAAIDVVVHLNHTRQELNLDQVDRTLSRFIEKLPGS